MPKYRVLSTSFINNTLVQPGDVVDYDGKPGSALELLDAPKGKSKQDPASAGNPASEGQALA